METGIYISSQAVSASHFALLLVIRKSNTIHAQSHFPQIAIKNNYLPKTFFQMSSLSVE